MLRGYLFLPFWDKKTITNTKLAKMNKHVRDSCVVIFDPLQDASHGMCELN